MSGISLDYKLDIEQPIRAFQALQAADQYLLLSEIGEYVVTETLLNFDGEHEPDGTPWIPSKRDGKTLTDRGHLRDSITQIVAGSGDSVAIGSNMEYAAIHQFGGEAGRNRSVEIDARPYLGITPEMQVEIGDMVVDFYNDVVGGA